MARVTIAQADGVANCLPMLDMLRYSEGTSIAAATQDDGYDILFGGGRFDSYADHPNISVPALDKAGQPRLDSMTGQPLYSTAAGGYQILHRFWVPYKAQLRLPDFSPVSQELVALQMFRECHAIPLIAAGQFAGAVAALRSRWASLPGAGYMQPEHSIAILQAQYIRYGGTLA